MSTAELIKIDAKAAGHQLSTAVANARAMVAAAADEFERELLTVQAVFGICHSLGEETQALLLAAGELGYYELIKTGGKSPPPEEVMIVCAKAYMKGLQVIGVDGAQFSVYPKKGAPADLYMKEQGYRHWFKTSGRASEVDVDMGRPEYEPFHTAGRTKDSSHDTAGKAMVLFECRASVYWDGRLVCVECAGKYRIAVKGFETDGVAKIQSNAERKLIEKLWKKCQSIPLPSPAATGMEPVTYKVVPEPPAGRDWDKEKAAYVAEWIALPVGYVKDVYAEVMRAENSDELSSLVSEAAKEQMDRRHRDALTRAVDFRREWLAAQEVAP